MTQDEQNSLLDSIEATLIQGWSLSVAFKFANIGQSYAYELFKDNLRFMDLKRRFKKIPKRFK